MVEITAREQNKEKRMKRIEDRLRDLWDNSKCTYIQIIGVLEEEKKKGSEKILEDIIVENFPKMGKEIIKSRKHREYHTGKTQRETRQDTYESNHQKLNTKKKY